MHDEPDSIPAASSREKMAIQLHEYEHSQTEQQAQSFLCDTLYCEEEDNQWEEEEEEGVIVDQGEKYLSSSVPQHDLFWEDEELVYLFSKEVDTHIININGPDPAFILARGEAIEWILKVVGHYGFNPLTTILAINYLNRFLLGLQFQRESPWVTQLVAVACLSLAAKVEETQVPFLLDLQVGDAEFLFDAKTVLKMELLVLSTLEWRMNPVTPFSFIDHIMRRLWSQNGPQWDFRRRCERLLVSVVSDWKSLGYKPSVLAAATMLEVIDQVEPWKAVEYQEQLLTIGFLKLSQDEVNGCSELIRSTLLSSSNVSQKKKRKHDGGEHEPEMIRPVSPNGVIDAAAVTCDDSSNDSWAVDSKKMRKNK